MGILGDSPQLCAQNRHGELPNACALVFSAPPTPIWSQLPLWFQSCLLPRTWLSWFSGHMILGEIFSFYFLLGDLGTVSFLPHRVESCEDVGEDSCVLSLALSIRTVLGC